MNFRTILSTIAAAAALCASASTGYAPVSRLSQGHWVKIKVTQEGIHQITPEQLRLWGFSNPDKVAVYGYGGTLLAMDRLHTDTDDLQPAMHTRTADGRLLFYADATLRYDLHYFDGSENFITEAGAPWRRNIYSDGGYYFLSDSETTQLPEDIAAPDSEGDNPYTGHIHVDANDDDHTAPMAMGSLFFNREFTGSAPYAINISATDRVNSETEDGAGRNAMLCYTAYMKSTELDVETCAVGHNIDAKIEPMVLQQTNAQASRYSVDDWFSMRGAVAFAAGSSDLEGTVELTRPAEADGLTYYIDRHAFIYPRLNRLPAGERQLVMQYPSSVAGQAIKVQDATESLQLWDVSSPADVRRLSLRLMPDGSALASMPQTFSRNAPGRLVLFDTGCEHPEPEFAGEVEPQNIHSLSVPRMVIITTESFRPYAQELADAHRRIQGIDVAVVTSQQVFNEFSSGTPTPMAYRRMARMFYDRDPEEFRYVLMLGPSRWDHRGIVERTATEQLAIYECNVPDARATSTSVFCSDAFVGFMDDFDYTRAAAAQMQVSVGRLPATSVGEAIDMVRHTIEYMENPPSAAAMRRVVAASAPEDRYEHFEYSQEMNDSIEGADGGFIVSRVPLIAYPAPNGKYTEAGRSLQRNLDEGRGLFTYFGHSTAGNRLTSASFYGDGTARSLDYKVAPMAFLATCNAFAQDRSLIGVAADMLVKRGGGAIAVIAACRSVYSHLNRQFSLYVADAYTGAAPGATTGDIFRTARNTMISERSNSQAQFNTNCYGLCGDPAVKIAIPEAEIVLTSVNGAAPGEKPVAGLSVLRLEGYVAGEGDAADDTFNGKVEVTVFNTATAGTVQLVDKKASSKPEIVFTNRPMATTVATAEAGRWTAEVFLPELCDAGNDFALNVDATNDKDGSAAHGYFTGLPTADSASLADGTDISAPEISEMYIDSPDFANGDEVESDFTLHARITLPATGLCLNSAPLAGESLLILDGSSTRSNLAGYITDNGDGTVSLDIPYRGVTQGRHHIRLVASNNVGQSNEHSVSFAVNAHTAVASMAVEERPARAQATFAVDHTLGDNADIMIVIEDATGNTVRCIDSAVWDLRDTLGAPVPDGIYSAYALVLEGMRRTHTEPVEVIVLHDAQ